jgi:hypothetical protein
MILQASLLAILTSNSVEVVSETARIGNARYETCAAAIEQAERLDTDEIVECVTSYRVKSTTTASAPGHKQQPSDGDTDRLRRYRQVDEIELSDDDASGVTFVADDTVLITYQDSLEFRRLDGAVLETIRGVEGDVEGLEYSDGRLFAVAERGSTRIDLDVNGTSIVVVNEVPLPSNGVECIAFDPVDGTFYYGIESSGELFNDKHEVVATFSRDLVACAVVDGNMLIIVSHPWRSSFLAKLDMPTWQTLEVLPLPDGDWEGVACRKSTCVLVRETSHNSAAAMVVFEREAADEDK